MNELKAFKTNLKIDDEFYHVQLDDKGHITDISIYDCEYMEFQFDGDLLQALIPFSHLKNLDIAVSDYTITDLSALSNFRYLEQLKLEDCCKIDDISAIAGLKQLTHLSIDNAGISDITALQQLSNLFYLCLSGNKITTINALKEHKQLVNVNFSFNHIEDISALLHCKKIITFSIDCNQISNLSIVAGFTQIEYLSFCNNKVDDLNFLKSLSLLNNLSFQDNPVTDITPLNYLTNLQNLFMQGVSVVDLEPIKHAVKLNYLSAGPVENFDGVIISRFVELSFLRLQHCNINNISFLGSLQKLTNLNLDHNQIADVNALYECKMLRYIYLRDNAIQEPFIADSFVSLTSVDLRENEFGGKIFVSYKYDQQEDQEQLTDLNQKVADHYLKLGENDKALAFFYMNNVSKTTLKIRFEELLTINPKDVFYLKYYIICCANCLANLLNTDKNLVIDDPEIETIFTRLKEIISQTTFIDKAAILESLNNYKQYYKYVLHEEYIKYHTSDDLNPKKEYPEIIYKLGRNILKRETISEVLYIYKKLVTIESPFQYPLYKELNKFFNSNFSSAENLLQNRYRNLSQNITENNLPEFILLDYYQRNYSQNLNSTYKSKSVENIDNTDPF